MLEINLMSTETREDIEIDVTLEQNEPNKNTNHIKSFFKAILHSDEFKDFMRWVFIIILIAILLLLGSLLFLQHSDDNNGLTISTNLVAEHGATSGAWLGYEFTPELIEAIENCDIDLYGVIVSSNPNSSNIKMGCELLDGPDAIPGTASRLTIVSAEYIFYTQEWIDKYCAGHKPSKKGYWNYTIGLVEK